MYEYTQGYNRLYTIYPSSNSLGLVPWLNSQITGPSTVNINTNIYPTCRALLNARLWLQVVYKFKADINSTTNKML